MAYINQEKKAQIKAELDKVLPKGWTITLKIDHYTSLTATIRQAPMRLMNFATDDEAKNGYYSVNHFYLGNRFHGEALVIMQKIVAALNCINYDKSEPQWDHFDVGYYLTVRVGEWNKPFVCTK